MTGSSSTTSTRPRARMFVAIPIVRMLQETDLRRLSDEPVTNIDSTAADLRLRLGSYGFTRRRVCGQDAVRTAHRFSARSIASVLVGLPTKTPKETTDLCPMRPSSTSQIGRAHV